MSRRRSAPLALAWLVTVVALALGDGPAQAGMAVPFTQSDERSPVLAPAVSASTVDREVSDTEAPPLAKPPPDPLEVGPYAVTATEYDYGDTAFTPPTFPGPIEVRASVHYPTDLGGGPRPLVMLMHGRHATCYKGPAVAAGWPCRSGFSAIPSYRGYDYLAHNLASWGYIVVSVSTNGINAKDATVEDLGMAARAQLMQLHLDTWETFSTTGAVPFGDLFVGKVDMHNIGEMGHSRGGEGVVQNYLLNAELGAPYGIQAVYALAPVDFGREVITGVPLSVAVPYCDGDVIDLQGVHFYDDARYASTDDQAPKYVQEILAANHNYFNTVWTPGDFPAGTVNDSTCQLAALTPEQRRNVGEAYMAAYFRLQLGGETAFVPYFNGSERDPVSTAPAEVHTSYHAGADDRRDVNRYLDEPALSANHLGGTVTHRKLTPFYLCGGADPQPAHCLPVSPVQQPHTAGDRPGLSQIRYGWENSTGRLTNAVPRSSRDVSGFAALTFRVARDFSDPRNDGGSAPNFSVRLSDGDGRRTAVKVGRFSDAIFPQPGTGNGLPKLVLNTVRIPLSAFDRVDLTDVREIAFRHDVKEAGAVVTTDLAFTDRS